MLERWARPWARLWNGTAGVMDALYRRLGRPGKLLQDFLNGSWLGHSLHPVVVDVVVGGSTVAVMLQVLSWLGVADLRVAILWVLGLTWLAGLSAIATGLTDFKDTATGDERHVVGLHGLINMAATAILIGAFVALLGEADVIAGWLIVAGFAVLSVGAFIGGHVVFKYGYMVNHNAFAGGKKAKEYTPIMPAAGLAEATLTKAMLGPTALVVVRRGNLVFALKETCSHAGGPLSQGTLAGDTIVCPWHASAFRISDGAVRHGPAATRQVAYRARISGNQVEVQGPIASRAVSCWQHSAHPSGERTRVTYRLTADHDELRAMVREIADERVAPRAAEIDATSEFPWDLKELLAKQDLLGIAFPARFGGTELDNMSQAIVVEEIARADATTSLIVIVQKLGALPIMIAGTEEQQARYLPRLASGEWLAAFGLTEAGAGSDVAGIRMRARLDGDDYLLNGSKRFITHGSVANLVTIIASTDPEAGSKGLSAFIVETDTPGFSAPRLEHKMGIRGSPTAELHFDDVRVPVANRLGAEGEGFTVAMATLDRSRLSIAAQAVGIAQGALDFAVGYAAQREQFGARIADLQGIQFMLADMASGVEAARQLTYAAAAAVDANAPDLAYWTSSAKLIAGDMAMRVTTDAVQVLGGYGYVSEYPVERMMRDAKITQLYEGTQQVQRMIVARHVLRRAGASRPTE